MARESKLEQIQLISKFIVLIDGAPDNNCSIAKYLKDLQK